MEIFPVKYIYIYNRNLKRKNNNMGCNPKINFGHMADLWE